MESMKTKNKGFTIIELVLVIVIMGILLGLAGIYYNNSQLRADINSQANNIVHYLRLAQSNAVSGLNGVNHGIHFESSFYVTFEGDAYDQNSPQNFRMDLPATMTINSIALNGSGSDVIFQKGNGETEEYGSISLNSAQIGKTIPITITAIGTINY